MSDIEILQLILEELHKISELLDSDDVAQEKLQAQMLELKRKTL